MECMTEPIVEFQTLENTRIRYGSLNKAAGSSSSISHQHLFQTHIIFNINLPVDGLFILQSSNTLRTYASSVLIQMLSYCKVASTSPSCLEAHTDFFRLSTKEEFDIYLV